MLTLLAGLVGCGGGGGDPVKVVEEPTQLPQGIWQGASGSDSLSVLVLPTAQESVGELWAISRDSLGAIGLYNGNVNRSGGVFTGSGQLLSSSPAAGVSNATVSASRAKESPLVLSFSLNAKTANLTYSNSYDTPAKLSDWSGAWRNLEQIGDVGALATDWSVTAGGAITGQRSDGCKYTGDVALRPEAKSIVNVTVVETCPAPRSTTATFKGIGAPGLDSDGKAVGRIVTLVRADGLSFSVLLFSPHTPS